MKMTRKKQIIGMFLGLTLALTNIFPAFAAEEVPVSDSVPEELQFYTEEVPVAEGDVVVTDESGAPAPEITEEAPADVPSEETMQEEVEALFQAQALPASEYIPSAPDGTPLATHGKLSVQGTVLKDSGGQTFRMQGISLSSINYDHWYAFANEATFTELRDVWNCNTIRLPMYTSDAAELGYCTGDDALKDTLYNRMVDAVNLCERLGMYAIIDWHVITEGDPNTYVDQSVDFHNRISARFAQYPNVIYEICNEPNNIGAEQEAWATIKNYANQIIPVIRANDPNAVVIVGTPNYSGSLWPVSESPLEFGNVMYAKHAYTSDEWAGTDSLNDMTNAVAGGIPVAVTEISAGTANGPQSDVVNADMFNQWMNAVSSNEIPLVFFSLCKEDASCAILNTSTEKMSGWNSSDLTEAGKLEAAVFGASVQEEHIHSLTPVAKVEPSCSAPGQEAYWQCSECGAMFSDEAGTVPIEAPVPIAQLEHTWETRTERTEPTCDTAGSEVTKQVCTVCGAVNGEPTVVEIPAPGHQWDEGVVTKEASCAEEGVITYTCARDASHQKTEPIAKKEHTPGEPTEENRVEPTCETAGSFDTVVRCTVCNGEISRETTEIPALGHQWDEGKVTKEASCAEEGVITYTCARDASHQKTEPIAKKEHTPGDAVEENRVEPTCDTAGSYDKVVRCTVCKAEISRETIEIPALGHQWDEGTVTKDSTCAEEGVKTFTCARNPEHQKTEPVPKKEHTPGEPTEENRKEATCDVAGSYDKVVRCMVCKQEISRETVEIPALGHQWDAGVVTKQPSCSEEGITTFTCARDANHQRTEPIAKTAHEPSNVAEENRKEATCEAAGSYEKVTRCVNCGQEISREVIEIPALGHQWDAGVITKQPSCAEEGVKTFTCARDASHQRTEAIPKTEHAPGQAVEENRKEATCEAAGSVDKVVRCTVCNGEISRETTEIPALGHDWDEGKVTKEATCKEEGTKTYTCKRDSSHTKTEAIPKKTHTPGEAVQENRVEPTEEKEGSYDKVIYCTVCKEEMIREKIVVPKKTPAQPTGTVTPSPLQPIEEIRTPENTEAKSYTLAFNPNGGQWSNESTAQASQTFKEGAVIRMPNAPTRAGYKFLYWDSAQYAPGASYTVTEDRLFTAVWEVAAGANQAQGGSNTTNANDVQTGDENILPSIILCSLAACGLILIAFRRKRKNKN